MTYENKLESISDEKLESLIKSEQEKFDLDEVIENYKYWEINNDRIYNK